MTHTRKLGRRLLIGALVMVLLGLFWTLVLKPDELRTYHINWVVGLGVAFTLTLGWLVYAVISFIFDYYRIMRD